MSPLLLVVVLLSILEGSRSQLVRPGRCPDVTVKQNFDVQQYLGRWFQRATFGTALFQGLGRCVTADYSATPIGTVDVYNSQLPTSIGSMKGIRGTAKVQEPEKMEGKLLVTFPIPVIGYITSPYWVLDTDYSSWALVYSCLDLGVVHTQSGWILTRQQDLSRSAEGAEVEAQLASALRRAGLTRSMFTDTDQSHC